MGVERLGVWHGISKRKPTGGLNHSLRARMKRKREMGSEFVPTLLETEGEEKRKVDRRHGGMLKVRVRKAVYANVAKKDGTVQKVKILSVEENRANRHFSRIGVITRGAIINTEIGKAMVTSRPNQDGVVNAVLLE